MHPPAGLANIDTAAWWMAYKSSQEYAIVVSNIDAAPPFFLHVVEIIDEKKL